MALVDDPSAYLTEFGVAAVFGAYSATVLLDRPDREFFNGEAQSADYQIEFATADLPGLQYGSAITVGGTAYTVIKVLALDDGTFSTATLQA